MPPDDELRVQVRVSAREHPELYSDLAGLRPRCRAERLRQVAIVALMGLARTVEPATSPPPLPDRRRSKLLNRLKLDD